MPIDDAIQAEPTASIVRRLPKVTDHLALGVGGLKVSPLCLGCVGSAETVIRGYESGINFFFLSADLHWPLYEPLRQGLIRLLDGSPSRRDEIVVAVVSYLDEPLFEFLQVGEVLDAVPGLKRVDVLLAGGVANAGSFGRLALLKKFQVGRYCGVSAIGASFHERRFAVAAERLKCFDIYFIRYNPGHTGARTDLFPHLGAESGRLKFSFNCAQARVTEDVFRSLNLDESYYLPSPSDYYRFALTHPSVDGLLVAPANVDQLDALIAAVDGPALDSEEEQYMVRLSTLARRAAIATHAKR